MKKNILTVVFAVVLLLAIPVSAEEIRYNSASEESWAEESVARAIELGLFRDTGNETIQTGQPMSRGAFAAVLTRLFRWEEEMPEEATYTDVAPWNWYYGAVEAVATHEAVAADTQEFRPTENLTREEMASMLVRGLGYTSLAGTVSEGASPFTDVSTNKGFITMAYDLGILGGVGGGKFNPSGIATQEQVAAAVVRLYDRLYATSTRLANPGHYRRVAVDTPAAEKGGDVPTTPLEPMPELYSTLRELKENAVEMDNIVLLLTAGGVRTVTDSDGNIRREDTLTASEVRELLKRDDVATYYSERYDSAYCIFPVNEGETATVWYQSAESREAKLQMARLFGVTHYMVV